MGRSVGRLGRPLGASSSEDMPSVYDARRWWRARRPAVNAVAAAKRGRDRGVRVARSQPPPAAQHPRVLDDVIVIASYLWLRLGALSLGSGRARAARRELSQRAPHRAHDQRPAGPVHQGRAADQHHDELPAGEFRRELEGFQDSVPPRPYEDIEARIVEELGKTPAQLFESFEKMPIASASIGQVHIARLLAATKVAVKVQYPDIEEVVRRDSTRCAGFFASSSGSCRIRAR